MKIRITFDKEIYNYINIDNQYDNQSLSITAYSKIVLYLFLKNYYHMDL